MAQWVKVGNIRGPAGEIPDVSEFVKTDGHFFKYGDDYMPSVLVSSSNSPANAWRAGVYALESSGTGISRIQLFGPNGSNPNPQTYIFATEDYGSYATFRVAKNSEGNMLLVGVNNDLRSFVGSEFYPVSHIFAADLDDAATDKRVPNKKYVDDAIAAIPDPDLSGYLPKTGGTLTGNVDLNTGTAEPNLSIKRTVDGGTTSVEGRLRIDSDGVVGLRSIVGGTTVNNLYLEQTQTRLTKPLSVSSGGVPQDGTVGQILKKGQNGAEWVDDSIDTSNLVNFNYDTSNFEYYSGGRIDHISIPSTVNNERMVDISTLNSMAKISVMESSTSGVQISSDIDTARVVIDGVSNSFQMGDKSVTGITDDASSGSSYSLATAKAVKDYVDALSATLSTPDVDEFLTYLDEP